MTLVLSNTSVLHNESAVQNIPFTATAKLANALQLLAIQSGARVVANISDTGLVWSSATTFVNNGWGSNAALFYTMTPSTVTSVTTINLAVGSGFVAASLDQATGCDTSGTSGSGALVQIKTGTGAITLAALGSTNNAAYGMFSSEATLTGTAGASFTTLGVTASVAGLTNVLTEYSLNTTTVKGTVGAHPSNIALEIKAQSGGNVYNVSSLDTATATDTVSITDILGGANAENITATDAYSYVWQRGPFYKDPGGAGWRKWHQTRPGGSHPGSPRRPF